MITATAVLAASRFGQDAAVMLVWGGAGMLSTAVPRDLADRLATQLRAGAAASIALLSLATAAALPAEIAGLGDGWGSALDPAVVQAFFRETNLGPAWSAQAGAALLLVAAASIPGPRRTAGLAVASGLALASLGVSGHAAMDEGWRGVLHRGCAVLHVLSAGAWLGALVPVLLILGDLDAPGRRRDAMAALIRFSRAGHVAVALALASGVGNAALVLKRVPSDWASPYQALLGAKVAAVAAMVALALVNRYVAVPRLRGDPESAIRALRRGTLAEVALGLGAVALVSALGLSDPG